MVELDTIHDWVRAEYNKYISVYKSDSYVRVTNGSGGHSIDIRPDGDQLLITGERDSETIDKSCDATRESLIETLSRTI